MRFDVAHEFGGENPLRAEATCLQRMLAAGYHFFGERAGVSAWRPRSIGLVLRSW
jgi:hypothetical protein